MVNNDLDTLSNDQFILKGRLSAQEYFAEGLTQILFGYPLTKLLLHTVIEPKTDSTPEVRRAGQYLSLPTITAVEIAHMILSTAKQSEQLLLKDVNDESKSKIEAILRNFQLSDSVGGLSLTSASSAGKTGSKKTK